MASEAEASELSAYFERIMRDRDFSLLMPFFFGLASATAAPRPDPENPDRETNNPPRETVIFINPLAQRMVVIEGDSLMQEFGDEAGRPPASKASIDAMPCVKIVEGDAESECVICLEQFEIGGEAREMPCKHRFHGDCINKWLKLHGSCPVCRFMMPVEEEEVGKKGDEGNREIRVSFYIDDRRTRSQNFDQTPSADLSSQDSDQIPSAGFNGRDSSSNPAADDDMQS